MTTLIVLTLLQMAAADPLPFFASQDMTPYWPQTDKIKAGTPAKVTHFKAIDQDAKPITESEIKGHISLVNFFFVQCPGLCPAMMRSVQKIQKALVADFKNIQILSFSVKPDQDTPEKLKEYSKTYSIDGKKWKLLTGTKKDIYRVGKDMFKAEAAVSGKKNEDAFIHTQNIYLVDSELYIRGIYNTSDDNEMKNLAADIRTLISQ